MIMSAAFNTLYVETRINIKLLDNHRVFRDFSLGILTLKDYIFIFNTE